MTEHTAPAPPAGPGARTRQRILEAAERLMRTIGLARVTTKEIARAADCSEATLYKYFPSKVELFVAVLEERMPSLGALIAGLTAASGEPDPTADRGRTTEQALADIALTAAQFYESSTPIAASLFAEPALLQRHVAGLRALDVGPHRPVEALADYLRAEQAHGRVRPDADPDAAATLLLGACFQRAFLRLFLGDSAPTARAAARPAEEFAASLARTLMTGIG